MKKVLFLTYHFYPRNDSALQRVAAFYKYLPDYGWEPWVVCPKWVGGNCDEYSSDLQGDLESSRVISAFDYLRPRYRGRRGSARYALKMLAHPRWLINRIGQPFFGHCLFRTPEELYFSFLRILRKELVRHNFDAIYATAPPLAPIAAASWANRRFGVPWIADFRDNVDQGCLGNSLRKNRRLTQAEVDHLGSASAILSVSTHLALALKKRNRDRVHVITNGFDPEHFESCINREPASKFTIAYLGTIYDGVQDPIPLFKAIQKLIDERAVDPGELSVQFYGKVSHVVDSGLAQFPQLKEIVSTHNWVSHTKSVAIQQSANALLHLAVPSTPGILTGKLFEYLASRTPILCIPGDGGEVDEVIMRSKAGCICRNTREVANCLRNWVSDWRRTGQPTIDIDTDFVSQFSRRSLTKKLALLLDAASIS